MHLIYESVALLIEGRVLETIPECGARCGVLRQRLVTAAPGGTESARQALRPVPRGASLHALRRQCRRRKRGTGSRKPPRWSAERRASLRRETQGVSQTPGPPCAGQPGAAAPGRLSALRPPLGGGTRFQNSGANAPRERLRLFDK